MIKTKRMARLYIAVILMLSSASFSSALNAYPSKPTQLICPFAPGGDSDLSARIVAEKLQEILGQPVLIVNKPGAGSALGINFVIASKPDGYTISTSSAPMVFLAIIMAQTPFKIDDLVPSVGPRLTTTSLRSARICR